MTHYNKNKAPREAIEIVQVQELDLYIYFIWKNGNINGINYCHGEMDAKYIENDDTYLDIFNAYYIHVTNGRTYLDVAIDAYHKHVMINSSLNVECEIKRIVVEQIQVMTSEVVSRCYLQDNIFTDAEADELYSAQRELEIVLEKLAKRQLNLNQ